MFTLPQNNTTRSVKHSKENALDAVAFEDLYHAAGRVDDPMMRLQTQFAVLVLGRLGLRASELAHLKESWIDWRREVIEIPRHQPCEKGRGGGPCARCKRCAEQVVEHADADVSVDAVLETYWQPKTEAGIRGVNFGWSPRTQYILEEFFEYYDEWPRSVQVVNRRIERAAEHSEYIEPDEISPHPLRATSASHLAGMGVSATGLMQHHGWADFQVATAYVETSTDATKRQLESLNTL